MGKSFRSRDNSKIRSRKEDDRDDRHSNRGDYGRTSKATLRHLSKQQIQAALDGEDEDDLNSYEDD